jgi:response regulator RpfG family c-di-GMP phosphodiesterase
MTENPTVSDAAPASGLRILCVDDEPGILSALRRLFRARGYQVYLAEGGRAGLALLQTQAVDLVISDMRMPEMDGVEFLAQVRQRWPDSVRLLLTGYADIGSVVEAINRGEIYRYITKPWDDGEMALIVREALAHRALVLEQKRLADLLQSQNEALQDANALLEARVQARTAELQQASALQRSVNGQLKASFVTSIKVFTALVELRGGNLAGHARRVADLARRIAQRLALDAAQAQEIFVAALLHEIGKVGLADELLDTPVLAMTVQQLERYRQHPMRAAQLLIPLPDLRGSADIIAAQLERFDGTGHPRRLLGQEIPLGARIVALASDYDNLQIGTLALRRVDAAEALGIVVQSSGKRYDPTVVRALVALLGGRLPEAPDPARTPELALRAGDLQPGMVLSRDLITPSGLLMLSTQHVLDDKMIRKVIDFEQSAGLQLIIHVCSDRKNN